MTARQLLMALRGRAAMWRDYGMISTIDEWVQHIPDEILDRPEDQERVRCEQLSGEDW